MKLTAVKELRKVEMKLRRQAEAKPDQTMKVADIADVLARILTDLEG